MGRFVLNRRHVLRGMVGGSAVSIALSPLEAMFNNHGTAYAQGGAVPKRFGVWFFPGGIVNSGFYPSSTGPGWTAPGRFLAPLADPKIKGYISIVSGMDFRFDSSISHHFQRAGALSNSYDVNRVDLVSDAGYGGPTLPSIDQVVAAALPKAKFPSIEVAVSSAGPWSRTMSWKGPGQRMPGELVPKGLFTKLFGSGVPAGMSTPTPIDDTAAKNAVAAQKSVLDTILQDAADLSSRLGAGDKQRLDAHLEGIREIEKRVALPTALPAAPAQNGTGSGAGTCAAPQLPAHATPGAKGEDHEARSKLFADILALAMACDLTRTFNFEFAGFQTGTRFWQVGSMGDHHLMGHGEEGNRDVDFPNSLEFMMKQFAYFVHRLQQTQEGAGNLLDSMCLYGAGESGEMGGHSLRNQPIFIIGKANGALKSGIHVRGRGSADNAGKALLTMVRAMGLKVASFGAQGGVTTEVIPELLA